MKTQYNPKDYMLFPAWEGLPRRLVIVSLICFAMWWLFGYWLYQSYEVIGDESGYTDAARIMSDGDIRQLAAGVHGTMARPYLYSLFVRLSSVEWRDIEIGNRVLISLTQACTYLGISLRIAQKISAISPRVSKIIIIGTLCNPFAIVSQHEILSDTLALNVFLGAILIGIYGENRRNGKIIARSLQDVIIASMVFIRSAAIPLGVMALISSPVCMPYGNAEKRRKYVLLAMPRLIISVIVVTYLEMSVWNHEAKTNMGEAFVYGIGLFVMFELAKYRLAMIPAYSTILALCVLAYPQYVLIEKHERINKEYGNIFGSADAQIAWGIEIAKYAAFVSPCSVSIPSGVIITNPFIKLKIENIKKKTHGLEINTIISWYFENPSQIGLHLYAVIQRESFGTYITKPYPWLSFASLAISALIKSIALVRIPGLTRRMWVRWRSMEWIWNWELQISMYVLISWIQNSVVAPESRFGHVIMLALTLIAVDGIMAWTETRARLNTMIMGSVAIAVGITVGDIYWLNNYSPLGYYFGGQCM